QSIAISGKVLDEKGEGLPGVTVLAKGTTTGTITDIEGNYNLEVEEDATIIFSFVGYKTIEQPIMGRTVLDVTMELDITALEEVVIVGYGEVERRKLTESISVVDAEKINSVPLASFDNILQGAASGVQVAPGGGQPGTGVAVRIRGISSINLSSAPLYVVDGIPINGGDLTDDAQTGNGLANLNPNDIESITVLKDASATSIYGSRAANGVVVITTKKGASGKAKVRYSSQIGFSEFENPNNFGVMNNQEFISLAREANLNAGFDPEEFPLGDTINTDWVDEVIQRGRIEQHDLSLSGGTDQTNYFASMGYYNEEGIVTNTGFERLSGRLNLQQEFNKKGTLGVNLSISSANQQNRQGGGTSFRDPIYGAFFLSPLYPVFANEEQIANGEDYGTGYNFNTPGFANHNTVASQELNTNNVQTFRTIGNIFAAYEIFDGLRLKTSFGLDRADIREDEFLSPNYERGRTQGAQFEGLAIANSITEIDWTSTTTLTYEGKLTDDHEFTVLLGNELFESRSERNRAVGAGFASDRLRTVNSAARPDAVDTNFTGWTQASFFSKINYGFQDKLFLNVAVRADGSSRFAKENRWKPFWSVGAAYVLSEESFLSNAGFIDFLKIRAGVGTQGNNRIGNFDILTSYSFNANSNLNGQTVSGSAPANLGNLNVVWEQQFAYDLGLDVSFLDRFNLSAIYYNKVNNDLLLDRPISRTSGFNSIVDNVGELRNYGVEIELTAMTISTKDFTWRTDFQFSRNWNEVIDIPNEEGEIVDTGSENIIREGLPVNSWYMPQWAGVDPANGNPLWFDENNNVTSDYSRANFRVVGSPLPDFYGSFGNTFTYKGISLSANFYFNYGNEVYREVQRFIASDGRRFGRNQDRTQLNRWQKPGDVTDVPRIIRGNPNGGNISSRYLEDGSFIKLRNVSVSYNLPKVWLEKAKISNVRIYATGFNILTFTNFRGLDPETGVTSRDFGEYPNPRKILFGLEIEL
ncbi:MAG: TonB-dependent receptor, partial [Bacteroidota bacterium]